MQQQNVALANHIPHNLILSLVIFSNHVLFCFCSFNIFRSNNNNKKQASKIHLGKIRYNHRRNFGDIFIACWQEIKHLQTFFLMQNSQWEVRSQESLSFPCGEQWLKRTVICPLLLNKSLLGTLNMCLSLILSLPD